jgi:anti-sigma factor RsiW
MISCEDVQALSTPYVDGELPARQRGAVEAHLRTCTACREVLAGERQGRAALAACRLSLRGVSGLCATARARGPAMRSGARRFVRLPVAATIGLVCVGVFGYGVLSRNAAAMAAQLTLDHLHCVSFVLPSGVPGREVGVQLAAGSAHPSDRDVEAVWERTYGWRPALPESAAREGFTLVALRRCVHARGFVAHALYRRGDRLISLYVFPGSVQPSGVLEIMGERASLWSHGAQSYAAIGSAPELDRFVAVTRAAQAAPAL